MGVQTAVSVIIGAELGGTFKGAFGNAKTQLSTLGTAIKGLNNASENVKAFTKLKSDTAAAKAEMKAAEDRVRALSAEIANTDKPSRELQANFRTATKEANNAKRAYESNAHALGEMGKKLHSAGVDTKNLAAEQSKLGSALETLKKRQAETLKIDTARSENMAKRGAYRSQIADVIALGGSLYGMIKPAIDFESAMADVKKVVDFDTPEELQDMQNQIKDLAKTIPLSLNGFAQIVAAGGQLGVPKDELAGFAETAAKMAVAFDISADEAGQSMAKLSNVLQMPIKEMNRVGDVINHLSNSMAATAPEIVEVTLRAGAMGKSFGLAYNDITALAGTFVAMGKTPEIAGTAINMMTSRLKLIPVSSGAARDAFNQLGISMKEYTKMVESGDGKQAILTVLEALSKVQGVKRSQIMKDMFGEQATRHINSLVESLDTLKTNFNMVANESDFAGSMQKEFAERSATTENNIVLLKSQMAILATNIGAALLPTINSLVEIFGKAAGTLADFADKHPTLIKYIGLAVAGMASAKLVTFGLGYGFTFLKGGVLTIMSVFTKARTIFSLLRLGMGGLIPIIRAVGTAFITNPIGLIITGIAVGAVLVIKYWEPIKEWFKGLWDSILKGWEKVKSVFQQFKEWMADTWIGKAWNWAFGSDKEKPKPGSSATTIGASVKEELAINQSTVDLPKSTISTTNQSSVSVNAPITINTTPGISADDVARQVSRELNAREQDAKRRARGANYD